MDNWAQTAVQSVISLAAGLGGVFLGAYLTSRQQREQERRSSAREALIRWLAASDAAWRAVGTRDDVAVGKAIGSLQSVLRVYGAWLPTDLWMRCNDAVFVLMEHAAGLRGIEADPRRDAGVVERHLSWVQRCVEGLLARDSLPVYERERDRPFFGQRGKHLVWTAPDEEPILRDEGSGK